MNKTTDLITKLSGEVNATKPLAKPINWIMALLGVLIIYAIILQINLGFRADILVQITRPLFVIEIILMVALFLVSIVAAVLTMYPDLYQKSRLLKLPYLIFTLLLTIFLAQLFTENDALMIIPEVNLHKMECTICIAFLALVPAIVMFTILQKGATTIPLQAGIFTVLAASALGYLMLRLQEQNDAISHLLTWHYLPMIFFAFLGALIGKSFLKW
jgi:hypothetical protein